ncbi:macrolide ABC transporter ATP-binding protein [Candidatus Acetothermia bacterium]|nr:ABC transporter ATP-binding protein [Candidatus Bipolaricaulota bacterium]RLE38306.1 MAG: macrolide ABC transporter ATP-binding protein [Candidatus Acetothermia bacterium]RLE41086.1 MAG: macrolide ABC transporter ATP-binding protein [Candidatus Acetothermia bacterium]HDJ30100.1 ABC transporter ATP-binding protein [Candidatus Acetothermia bacterium]
MEEEVLRLEGVTRNYRLGKTIVRALRGIDLVVRKEEILGVMGPSGSGKSTLLHILGALDTPDSGRALIDGTDITTLPERELTRLRGTRIGFVFQTFNLVATLTAQMNVELPMIFQRVPRSARAARAQGLLDRVGLSDRAHHRPNELSGGERQRVAIARALANDPGIILADEPTGNLDSESGAVILDLLQELRQEDGKTVIIVTHDPEAAAIADRIVRLKDGRVIEEVANV